MHENVKNALGYTFLPIIMEVENGSLQYYFSFLSFRAIFYFHDYGRKGTYRYLLFRLISKICLYHPFFGVPRPPPQDSQELVESYTRMFEKTPEKKRVSRKEVMVDIYRSQKGIFLAKLHSAYSLPSISTPEN